MLDEIETRVRTFAAAEQCVTYFEVCDVDAAIAHAIEHSSVAPYGVVPWVSAFVLAEKLARMNLGGKTVVDVGAGCGVVSLMASKLGAQVIALEIDALARQLLSRAAERQNLAVDVHAFDIGAETPMPAGDLYIFADLLYEAELAAFAAQRCIEAIERNACVWVGDPKRTGRDVFRERMGQAGHACDFREISYRVPDMERVQHVGVYARSPERWADVW